MAKNKYVVASLNRTSRGEKGTLFRVPNPGSEYDSTFTSAQAREVTLAFCKNEKLQHQELLKVCADRAGSGGLAFWEDVRAGTAPAPRRRKKRAKRSPNTRIEPLLAREKGRTP